MAINHYERAGRLWTALVAAAKERKTVTYKELFGSTDIHWRAQYIPLGLVQDFCMEENLPPLSILAVNNGTGLPGTGFIACTPEMIQVETERVFAYDWSSVSNPFEFAKDSKSIDEIIDAIRNGDLSDERFALIKSRGILQRLLKDAAMKSYGGKCAMCGLTIEELLEVCHIKPYSDCTEEERKDLRNILILCRNHHKLLDCGYIRLDESYKMHIGPGMELGSPADKGLFNHIDGVTISLPAEQRFYPGKEYIRYLNESH